MKVQLDGLHVTDEVLDEITNRATEKQNWRENSWGQYALILAAASLILEQAPQTREECEHLDIEAQMATSIGELANTLHAILPGGILELASYLSPEKRKAGWGTGINW